MFIKQDFAQFITVFFVYIAYIFLFKSYFSAIVI